MSGCDYCDEGLPLHFVFGLEDTATNWHVRRDPEGVELDQWIPCQIPASTGDSREPSEDGVQ